jgi:light-regulated signal transduction histidine kinase (bacteriophytochrome)
MSIVADLLSLSPYPLVDLESPAPPSKGVYFSPPPDCARRFGKDPACRAHYEELSAKSSSGELVQCPCGLASFPFKLSDRKYAFTSFVPYPRLGGSRERAAARHHPELRVDAAAVKLAAVKVSSLSASLDNVVIAVAQKHSRALHEIRKLNRVIKQDAERLYRDAFDTHGEAADPRIMRVFKASEMMSRQFDIIEILANQDLTRLPRTSPISVYRIFDKCVRVFQKDQRITIRSAGIDPGNVVLACDKTFPIIPTVLIENALKYSLPASPISVFVSYGRDELEVTVSNQAKAATKLDATIFNAGVRVSQDEDGSGYGLYVAQLVAQQHGTAITVNTRPGDHHTDCTFRIRFRYDTYGSA